MAQRNDIVGITLRLFFSANKPDFAAVRSFFFLVKNYPKYIFEKIHNQPMFKTICLP